MPRLRCPKCTTVVEGVAGAAIACPSCGFSATVPGVASAAAPPQAPAPAPAPAWGGAGKVVAIALAAVVVVGLLAAAGFVLLRKDGAARDLSASEAEARLESALASMPGVLGGDGEESAELRKVTFDMTGSPAGEGLSLGGGSMRMVMEWGIGDVRRIEVTSSGAVSISLVLYCGPDGMVMAFGEESYGSRPGSGGDECKEIEEPASEDAGVPGSPVPIDDLTAEGADIDVHRDGSLTATMDMDGEGTATVDLDKRGRLTRIVFEGAEGSESAGMGGTMDFEYGARRSIDIPEPDALIPASLETTESFDDATHTLVLTVVDSPAEPPLSEMELHVLDGFAGQVVASFPLDQASGSSGNVTYSRNDADGDGRLSAGDTITVSDPAWEWSFDAHAVVYDELAGGDVNSAPLGMPGLAPWTLGLAVLALAIALRRRR